MARIVPTADLYAAPSLMLVLKEFDPQKPAHAALAAVNVMTVWLIVVKAIGLVRLSGTSFAKAFAWLFGIALVWTGLSVGTVALMQLIGNR